jgi:hypothetical protein
MDQRGNISTFDRRITLVNNRPHIYVLSTSERREVSREKPPSGTGKASRGEGEQEAAQWAPFFGHHIGKLLAPDTATTDEFLSIDKELDTGLEMVRKKLQRARGSRSLEERGKSSEEMKHLRFINERNAAQEAMFEDIVRSHREFGTGLEREDLWSLHDLMVMEAGHEGVCALEESMHALVECDLLVFLRQKATEQAWQALEGHMARAHIPFPMSASLEDPAEPVRNEKVREERRLSAQHDFVMMPAQLLAELILGNVPNWVYSYPENSTYLWRLTVLQGITAGMAANLLMKYLSVWEESSPEILKRIEEEFMTQINQVRRRGESASELAEILSVSKELRGLSREQIPDKIWTYISARLGALA